MDEQLNNSDNFGEITDVHDADPSQSANHLSSCVTVDSMYI